MGYTYYPQAMHLHCSNQMGASIESHISNAAALGMKYIRLTGHDSRMGRRVNELDCFDFSRHALEYSDFDGQYVRLEPIGDIKAEFDGDALILSSSGEAGLKLVASGKRQTRPLASDITLTVGVSGDAEISLDIMLSQRPPDHEQAHYIYTLDKNEHIHILHVSDDIPENLGGLDNSLAGITLKISGGSARFDKLLIHSALSFEGVLENQRRVAKKMGKRWGVKPFLTFEVSDAGQHKNCFSTRVPIINYEKLGYSLPARVAVEHLKKYDALYSYNHPFSRYKRDELTDEQKDSLVSAVGAELIAADVWGAQMLEVGFPVGRHGFTLHQHLHLWDIIGLAGKFITGSSASDSHYSSSGWFNANNFATYIAADENTPFPVSEEEFEASMRAGRVYMGDPVYLHGKIDFTADGLPMGAIIPYTDATSKNEHEFCFTAENVEIGNEIRVIFDGEIVNTTVADSDTALLKWNLAPALTVSLCRVEMYNTEGRCILVTNPVYMVNTDNFAWNIPSWRTYGGNI